MKRTVLIVAEGEHELSGGTADAALPLLVRRLFGEGIDFRPVAKRIRELSGHMHPGRGNTLARKFIGIMRLAERDGYDAVIILIDQDDDRSRHHSATIAQETEYTLLPRAIGIAVRTFDAWFLADHAALSSAIDAQINMQPDPETNSDPKSILQGFNNVTNSERRLRDLYSVVASGANLEIVKQRCPVGFGVFAMRVEELSRVLTRQS